MVLRLVHLWNTAASLEQALLRNASRMARDLVGADAGDDLYNDDPESPSRARQRRKLQRQEQEAALDRDLHERRARKRDGEEADDSSLMLVWLESDEYRRSFEDLSNGIADARLAAVHAYDRAAREQQRAEEALKDARNRAIVLPDGRRAYFTRDGGRLYGEDNQQITDAAVIARAQTSHEQKPAATTYEEYVEKRDAMRRETENAQRLGRTLNALDDIESTIKSGNLSRDELAKARKDLEVVIASLPPEAQREYEQRKAVRQHPDENYRSAASLYASDTVFPAAPPVASQFVNAAVPPQQQPQPQGSRPGQKQAPESTDDYKPGL